SLEWRTRYRAQRTVHTVYCIPQYRRRLLSHDVRKLTSRMHSRGLGTASRRKGQTYLGQRAIGAVNVEPRDSAVCGKPTRVVHDIGELACRLNSHRDG